MAGNGETMSLEASQSERALAALEHMGQMFRKPDIVVGAIVAFERLSLNQQMRAIRTAKGLKSDPRRLKPRQEAAAAGAQS